VGSRFPDSKFLPWDDLSCCSFGLLVHHHCCKHQMFCIFFLMLQDFSPLSWKHAVTNYLHIQAFHVASSCVRCCNDFAGDILSTGSCKYEIILAERRSESFLVSIF
jgi:hypothetical protein